MIPLAGKTVLVTGGAGFIGCHLADALLAKGCRVKLVDNLNPLVHPNGAPLWIPRDAEPIWGNMSDPSVVEKALDGVELVFHQAGLTAFYAEMYPYLETNALGTARIYDVIMSRRLPVRKIVVASSLSVYGEGKYRCRSHGVVYPAMRSFAQLERGEWEPKCPLCMEPMKWISTDEDSSQKPFTPYAVSKHAAEILALARGAQLGIPTVALRYGVVYGPRQSIFNPYSSVATTFATLLSNGRPPVIYEDGLQCRDWIYIDDVVRANLFTMQDERTDFQAYNLGTGEVNTVRNLAEALAAELGRSIEPVLRGEFRVGDIRHLVLDVGKLANLGFKARVSFKEGIARFIAWFRSLGTVKEYYSALEKRIRQAGELIS